jgi:hypothetical protein
MVLEKYITSIFRAKSKPSKKKAISRWKACHLY